MHYVERAWRVAVVLVPIELPAPHYGAAIRKLDVIERALDHNGALGRGCKRLRSHGALRRNAGNLRANRALLRLGWILLRTGGRRILVLRGTLWRIRFIEEREADDHGHR